MPFKPSARKRIGVQLEETRHLRMTSLLDLFTNIVVVLILSYSPVEMNVAPTKFLHMPTSISTKMPIEAVTVIVATNAIIVEGMPVAAIDQNFEITGLEPSEIVIPNLYNALKIKRDKLLERAKLYKRESTDKVLIQADKSVPYRLLIKVLKTSGNVGFSKIVFLTYQKGE